MLPLCANANDAVQLGIMQPFAAQVAVVTDGKVVGMLLNIANQCKYRLLIANTDLLPFRGHQRPGTVAIILDHTEYRECKIKFSKGINSHIGMVDAAVDQQQIRRRLKAIIPCLVMGKSTQNDLAHRAVVILTVEPFQLKALIVRALGFSS